MSDPFQPQGLYPARLLCHPLSPGVCSNSCSLSQCCYLTISSSASPFFCLQLFPASGSFPVSQPFASGGQSIGALASASVRYWSEYHCQKQGAGQAAQSPETPGENLFLASSSLWALLLFFCSGLHHFWHQGPVLWKIIFSRIMAKRMFSGWFS